MTLSPFHIAIPVNNLEKAEQFYGGILGCPQGRRHPGLWTDYNFFGHQLVLHFTSPDDVVKDHFNKVDKQEVPVTHFGIVLSVEDWHALKLKLQAAAIKFIVEPQIRFNGQPGEQFTMFFKDPCGNNLQFKAMTNKDNLFAKYDVKEDQ